MSRYSYGNQPVECKSTHLLHSNKCQAKNPSYLNCAVPDFADTVNFTCQKCESGFYLNSEKLCEANFDVTLDSNCESLGVDNKCDLCKDNFVLARVHQKQQVVCESKISIENCLIYNTEKKGACLICKDGYLPDGLTCKLIADASATAKIENCESYIYGRCKKCVANYVRDLAGLNCVEIASLDSNVTDIKAGKMFYYFV